MILDTRDKSGSPEPCQRVEGPVKPQGSPVNHYIGDEIIFKAVAFACKLLSDGKSLPDACGISAHHYKVRTSEVALEFIVDQFFSRPSIRASAPRSNSSAVAMETDRPELRRGVEPDLPF